SVESMRPPSAMTLLRASPIDLLLFSVSCSISLSWRSERLVTRSKGTVHLRSCWRVHHCGFDDEGVVGHRVQKAECPIDCDSQVVDALLCQGLGLPRGLVVRRFVVLFI